MTTHFLFRIAFIFLVLFSVPSKTQNTQAINFWKEGNKLSISERNQEAIKAYEKGLKHCTVSDTIYSDLKIAISTAYFNLGNYQKQKQYLLQTLHTKNRKTGLYAIYNNLGLSNNMLGNSDSALFYLKKADSVNTTKQLKRSSVYDNYRQVYADLGFRDKELFYALKALATDKNNSDSAKIGSSMADLGEVFGKLKNFNKSEVYFKGALKLAFSTRNHVEVSRAYEGIGFAKMGLSQWKEADFFFRKGLQYDQQHHNPIGTAFGWLNLATLKNKQRDYVSALRYSEKSEQIFLQNPYPIGNIKIAFEKATALFGLRKYAQAASILEGSIAIAKKINGIEYLMKTYLLLAECDEETGKFSTALDYFKLYQKAITEQLKRENTQATRELTIKYETVQKERQITAQQVTLLQNEKQGRNTIIGGLIVFLALFGAFVWYRSQQLRRVARMQTQFVQTTKQLESFNYSVAHELLHPIIQMRNCLETMGNNPTKIQLDNIRQLLTHMNGLVQLMLQLSKIENEPLIFGKANTRLIVEDVVSAIVPPPHITIKLQAMPTVLADVFLLRQVFINLLQNAIKYSHNQPHPMIEINANCFQGRCRFCVKDNGAGFSPTEAKSLFTLFHRLHTNDHTEGYGVGLVIVKTIIEKHGGRVWAEGETGQGATFWFELPQ